MINASIVLFNNPPEWIENIISIFLKNEHTNKIYLIDNSPSDSLKKLSFLSKEIQYIFNNKNLGYGRGHNIAIRESQKNNINYHLEQSSLLGFKRNNDIYNFGDIDLAVEFSQLDKIKKLLKNNKKFKKVELGMLDIDQKEFGKNYI